MRPMKDPDFSKQHNGHAAALSFSDFSAKFHEQSLNVAPLDISAGGPSKDQFERALVLPLHAEMVPPTSTKVEWAILMG
jgi:hypothetical protein